MKTYPYFPIVYVGNIPASCSYVTLPEVINMSSQNEVVLCWKMVLGVPPARLGLTFKGLSGKPASYVGSGRFFEPSKL